MSRATIAALAGLVLVTTAGPARADNFWEKNCEAMKDFKVYVTGLYQGSCVCDAAVVNPNLEVGQLTVSAGEGLKAHGDAWNESLCYKKQGLFAKDRLPRVAKTRALTTTTPGLGCYKVSPEAPLAGVCGNIFHVKIDLSAQLGAKGMVWGEFAAGVKWGFEGKGYRGRFWSKEDGKLGEMPRYKVTNEANVALPSWSKATLTLDGANRDGTDTTNWYASAVGTTNMAVTTGKFLKVDVAVMARSPWLEKASVSIDQQTFCGEFDQGLGHVALAHATRYNCTNDPAAPLEPEEQEDLAKLVKNEELKEAGE
jgi:hypothetical protein